MTEEAKKRKAVVTGIGVVSPIGNDLDTFWKNLLQGRSGIGALTRFDASGFPCQVAAEVQDFSPLSYLRRRQVDCLPRVSHFASACYRMACEDAALKGEEYKRERVEVLLGTGMDSFDVAESQIYKSPSHLLNYEDGIHDPLSALKVYINAPSLAVALLADARGYVSTIASSCTSAGNSLGMAARRIVFVSTIH